MAGGHGHGVVTSTGLDVALAGVNGEGVVSIIAGQLEGCISILFGRTRGEVFKTFDAVTLAVGEWFTVPVEASFLKVEADFASDVATVVDECVVSGAVCLAYIEIARIVGVVDDAIADFLNCASFCCSPSEHFSEHFLQDLNGIVSGHCSE